MPMYRVIWEIDIGAESPEEAARKAREIQLDKSSMATFFDVHWENGTKRVDLLEEEEKTEGE